MLNFTGDTNCYYLLCYAVSRIAASTIATEIQTVCLPIGNVA